MDGAEIALVITTWQNPEGLRHALDTALASLPDYRVAFVIGNHPNDRTTTPAIFAGRPRLHFVPTGRVPQHEGRLAETWNLALQLAFSHGAAWCWGMHDDVEILPGWLDLVRSHPADFYSAPCGDMAWLLSRRGFREIGWWDEEYTCRDFHDSDYQLRAAWKLGRAHVVIENRFEFPGQGLNGATINDIGLRHFWRPTRCFDGAREARFAMLKLFQAKCGPAWLMPQRQIDLDRVIAEGLRPERYDWYPWFPR